MVIVNICSIMVGVRVRVIFIFPAQSSSVHVHVVARLPIISCQWRSQ